MAEYIPMPKKGDLLDCGNCWTVALISHSSKVLQVIILTRMAAIMNQKISREQAGFRSGKGTRDQLFNLKTIIEKTREYNQTIYLCFVDYSKAFDNVSYTQLWNIMHKLGFPHHLIRLIKQLYDN